MAERPQTPSEYVVAALHHEAHLRADAYAELAAVDSNPRMDRLRDDWRARAKRYGEALRKIRSGPP